MNRPTKEVKAYKELIEHQQKALDNLHKTILEDIKKINLLEYQNKEYKSVIHYLEFKLGQMAKVNDGK